MVAPVFLAGLWQRDDVMIVGGDEKVNKLREKMQDAGDKMHDAGAAVRNSDRGSLFPHSI